MDWIFEVPKNQNNVILVHFSWHFWRFDIELVIYQFRAFKPTYEQVSEKIGQGCLDYEYSSHKKCGKKSPPTEDKTNNLDI